MPTATTPARTVSISTRTIQAMALQFLVQLLEHIGGKLVEEDDVTAQVIDHAHRFGAIFLQGKKHFRLYLSDLGLKHLTGDPA